MSSTIWIFGLGYWAKILIAKINEQFKNCPIYIIDPNINDLKTDEFSKFELFKFSDIEAFMQKSKRGDFVFIFTPPSTHFQIAKVALEQMCHVWVEKPLCLEFNQAQELKEVALNNNLTLFIDNTFIYDDSVVKLKTLLEARSEKISMNITRTAWGKLLRTHGVIWDLLPHDLSIINYLLGEIDSYEVIDYLYNPNLKTLIDIKVKFVTKSGNSAFIHSSCSSGQKNRSIEVKLLDCVILQSSNSTSSTIEIFNLASLSDPNTPALTKKFDFVTEPIVNAIKQFKHLASKSEHSANLDSSIKDIRIMENIYTKVSKLISE
jgi:predicted dehydrogenase